MAYKLSSVLRGHEKDVRGICKSVFPSGGLISVSRDRTSRVWKKDEHTSEFIEGQCFSGHQGFVAAVCTMPESEKYPHGLIVTGGHDKLVMVWAIESLEPVQTLTGHEGAVCSLASGNYGTILSGSWDKTAKVWLGEKCVMTLQGHEQAVWAVALIAEQGMMLTASADRTIKMWKAGSCLTTFSGHTDCVRSLAVLSPTEFLSSSNDNTIRKWSSSGECLRIYEGHKNFVYSLAVLSNGSENFISTSEDRTVKVWMGHFCMSVKKKYLKSKVRYGKIVKEGICTQTITLPALSVWCSICLENGDIAAGSSDGVVRIFTCNPERVATRNILKEFEEEVASLASNDGKLGDINIDELPGPEALLRPGKADGKNLLIKRGTTIEAHQWNNGEGKWEKIGDVVGAEGTSSDGASKKSGKASYKGKEYDHVFDVDIHEGKPPLKLPYNLTDDPWFAAQQFLEENDLSQIFLDQVANFIMTNTKSVTIGPQTQSGYGDPFTGGSRYVPGSTTSNEGNGIQRSGVDPFTGQGSYRPDADTDTPMTSASDENTMDTENTSRNTSSYYPEKSYLSFDQVNIDGLMGRLKEFNAKVDEAQKLTTEDITEIQNILFTSTDNSQTKTLFTQKQMSILTTIIHWPTNICYPGLDILRLVIRNAEISKIIIDNAEELLQYLTKIVKSTEKTTNLSTTIGILFRFFSNLFSHERGVNVMLEQSNLIIECIKENCNNSNKIVQIAVCTVLINFAVALKTRNNYEAKIQCLNALNMVMQSLTDDEARFRALVALGTLIWGDEDSLSYAKMMDFPTLLKPLLSISNPAKVGQCATQLSEVLR